MSTPQNPSKNTEKKTAELKTDYPLSEKDEVKAAENKTAKMHKKATQNKKGIK